MITLIGSGNVAWHLAKALEAAQFKIDAIYSRNLADAEEITNELYYAEATNSLDFSDSDSDLFIIAVSDDAIEYVAESLILPEGVTVVHTSGSQPMRTLQNSFDGYEGNVNCGVFYPLMTFTKYKPVNLKAVPFCIEATDETTEKFLLKIARKLSKSVQVVSNEQRRVLHLSAVFACNFTNHLLAISQEIVEVNELDFSVLKPIIEETFQKALDAKHPADVQTGPAVRFDIETLQAHEKMLAEDPELRQIYRIMSESIQDFFE